VVLRDLSLRLIGTNDKLGVSRGERPMRRRGFIAAIAAVVAATQTLRPRVVFAQAEKTRRIGLLMGWSESNSDFHDFVAAFADELARLGWIDGRNARIEQLWTNADVNRARVLAQELVATQPDVIVTSTTHATAAVKRESNTIPIVFTVVSDPVGSGFVAALPRPGGNITGFSHTDGGLGGKWLTLLKEIAPDIKRAGIMFNPDTAPSGGKFFLDSFEAGATVLGVEPVTLPVRSDGEIETAIASLGRERVALALMDDSYMAVHYPTVIAATARNRVPAIFVVPEFVRNGGLLFYGADITDIFRRAAGYVDRILRGEKPADLPVQLPTKFEMAINLKTAKSLGINVPPALLATADEVIE
jgi:putative tryptophan/tyrosine transport system substrate-binding protein